MGMGGITNIQWENRLGEISLIIASHLRGEGRGEKAVELLLDQAFHYLNLHTVCGECYGCNSAVMFWKAVTVAYRGHSTVLWNRKFWQGEYWESLYFAIDEDGYRKAYSAIHPT